MAKISKRQMQVGEMIKRSFSMVLQHEGPYVYGVEPLVSVTHVIMSNDLGIAKIYLSVYNTENKQAVIMQMDNNLRRLKNSLSSRIGKQIRRVPNIAFYLDDTVDEMYRVEELFDKIQKKEGGTSE